MFAIDYLKQQERLSFIRSQLAGYSGQHKQQGNRVFVLCPFHNERTPSGKIDLTTGYFYCFGCGTSARWDEVAPMLGLSPFQRGKPEDEFARPLNLPDLDADDYGYDPGDFEFESIPKGKTWRSIPTRLLRDLGGRQCYRIFDGRRDNTRFLYFPVIVNQQQRGYFLARMRKVAGKPSYLQARATGQMGWVKHYGLWPFDYVVTTLYHDVVAIVEGQRDALRLISCGIPAMCIFGTQSWSDSKARLLELAGVNKIVVLMDGDDAGAEASTRIARQAGKFLKTDIADLSDYPGFDPEHPFDPADAPQAVINQIQKEYFDGI